MNALVQEVLAAHGGLDNWRSVTSITASGHVSGLLPKRFAGNKLRTFTFEVAAAEQRTIIHDYPEVGTRGVFDHGSARIEDSNGACLASRQDAREAFGGLRGLRRNFHWDPLDVTYFAGYASRNYLTSPLLLVGEGVTAIEGKTWTRHGERWRQLSVTFPANFHTHCRRQSFYVDDRGLIARHDFTAEPVGRWATASLYCEAHRNVEGLLFPTHRRVLPRGPRRRAQSWPTLLDLTFDEIEVAR